MSVNSPEKIEWETFAKLALSILAILSTFVLIPPKLNIYDQSTMLWLIRFLIAVLLSLMYIPQRRLVGVKYYKRWLIMAVGGLILGLFSLMIYNIMKSRWSIDFYGERVVVGKEIKSEAKAAQKRLSHEFGQVIEDKELVKYFAGRTEKIWRQETIEIRYYLLCLFYIIAILSLSFFLNSILQSISCYEQNEK